MFGRRQRDEKAVLLGKIAIFAFVSGIVFFVLAIFALPTVFQLLGRVCFVLCGISFLAKIGKKMFNL